MEEAVTFVSKNGKKLFGIVHIPAELSDRERRTGINLLNPGIKYRVAPHRLNVKLARELCNRGYYVLRSDPEGIGDSEGELPERMPVPDIWGKIQSGLFVRDVIAANDFFLRNYGIDTLALVGNCGGAITALLTCTEDTRINALCLIDLPLILHSSKLSFVDLAAKEARRMDWYFVEYLKRLVRPTSWYRFLTLKTDYVALRKTLKCVLKKMQRAMPAIAVGPSKIEEISQKTDLNPALFGAFENLLLRNVPTLFILAGNDPGTEVFQEYFPIMASELAGRSHAKSALQHDTVIIDNANHIYTLTEWQTVVISKIADWVDYVTCSGKMFCREGI